MDLDVEPRQESVEITVRGPIAFKKPLYNFDPPATESEIRAAATQFVRKVTGFRQPSRVNEAAFNTAIDEISAVLETLFARCETVAPPKNRAEEAAKARARSQKRFT